jgi:hypothetical protein
MKKYPKRYVPELVDNYLKNHIHTHIKWNKDLSSEIISLDYEGLVIACDTILRVSGSRELDRNNFCEIQRDMFKKILHSNYSLYIDYLIDNKIIISDNQYIVGEKSIGYKINEDFIDGLKSITIDDKNYNNRTLKAVKSTDKLKVSKAHQNNFYSSFKIDFNAAYNHLVNTYINGVPDHKGRVLDKYSKSILEHKLNQINDGQLWINRSDSNGRINSNLTILNGDYKQFILGYDYSIDIKNSQPLLLSLFVDYIAGLSGNLDKIMSVDSSQNSVYISNLNTLSSYVSGIIIKNLSKPSAVRLLNDLKSLAFPNKKELDTYRNLCERGEIYEFFESEVFNKTGNKLSRREVKQLFIINMYSPNEQKSEYKKLFASIFPTIYNFTTKIKSLLKEKRRHRILPILLQSVESYIMVERLLPKLDTMKIKYLFIHDSIIIREEDKDRSELTILQEFNYLKVRPSLSIEKLRK